MLGRLADDRPESSEVLLAEAIRWISRASDATSPAAIGLITDTLNRHQRLAARRGGDSVTVG
ncbi:hypothetical protein DPM19_24850 [Actinomadura craniellae]|uniref:Uncharacterized protein n=1 Tax=Actinomadura craniellae TaxID=2231787 RepID=A0A365H2D3_9ACTN|nr:hypothetical protein DPM19_24850 [Actinomadura craniellae]